MSDLFLQPLFTWRSVVASKFGPLLPTTRHVLLTLGLHMSEKGDSCFPSMALLAEESGLALSTVKEHIAIAARDGWIGKRSRRLKNGQGWKRNEYFAQIPADAERLFHEEQGGPAGGPRQHGPAGGLPQGGPLADKGGPPGTPKVVRQPALSTSGSTSGGKPAAARRASLPDGFAISDRVRAWATEKGFAPFLDLHLEKFLSSVKARGARYVDWDEALMNCIRDDWGDIRRKAAAAGPRGAAPQAERLPSPCGNCGTDTNKGSWTQSPKGRVCTTCHAGYMAGAWPVREEARA